MKSNNPWINILMKSMNIGSSIDEIITDKYKVDLSRLCVIQNKYQNRNILITYDDNNNEIIYKLEQNLNKTGTTEDRPNRPSIGFIYKDTTLNKLIIWEGTKWANLDGTELAQ